MSIQMCTRVNDNKSLKGTSHFESPCTLSSAQCLKMPETSIQHPTSSNIHLTPIFQHLLFRFHHVSPRPEATQLEAMLHLQHLLRPPQLQWFSRLRAFGAQGLGPVPRGQGDLMRQTFEGRGVGKVANLKDALLRICRHVRICLVLGPFGAFFLWFMMVHDFGGQRNGITSWDDSPRIIAIQIGSSSTLQFTYATA